MIPKYPPKLSDASLDMYEALKFYVSWARTEGTFAVGSTAFRELNECVKQALDKAEGKS